jgi:hypothetical protein
MKKEATKKNTKELIKRPPMKKEGKHKWAHQNDLR